MFCNLAWITIFKKVFGILQATLPTLQKWVELSFYVQYHSRRKKGAGCFTQVTKINAVLLLGALQRRKAWNIALILETDFSQEKTHKRRYIQKEGEKMMLQASFLTFNVRLKFHNKNYYAPSPAGQPRRCRNRFLTMEDLLRGASLCAAAPGMGCRAGSEEELQCAASSCFSKQRGFLACQMVLKAVLPLTAKILILLVVFFRMADISC